MYNDVLMKTEYYRQLITKDLVRNGIAPDQRNIKERLDRIDTTLAIYRHTPVTANTNFDNKSFSRDMYFIYQDLEFLFRLLYEITLKNLEQLAVFVDSHVEELENKAQRCLARAELETNATSLGKTLAVQTSGYSIEKTGGQYVVKLGPVTATEGSQLACLIDGTDLPIEDVTFRFKSGATDITCSPYSYHRDTVSVPGSPKTTTYACKRNDGESVNGAILMNIDRFIPNPKNTYNILGGENKLLYADALNNMAPEYLNHFGLSAMQIENAGNVSFYDYLGTSVSFGFSKPPTWTNFDGLHIDKLEDDQFFSIDCQDNTTIDFVTDGRIFAEMEQGIIMNNLLYFPRPVNVEDFLVVETAAGNNVVYDSVSIEIPDCGTQPDIRYIAIKDLGRAGA